MNLQKLRKEKKLTQEELSNMLNVSRATYNGYELEKYEPTIETLCKLADFYNVSLDYLVGRQRKDEIGYLNETQISIIKMIKQLNQQNLLVLTGRVLAMLESQGI